MQSAVGRCKLVDMTSNQQLKEPRQKRARRSRAEWRTEVRRWRRSGQSAADYAARRDLSRSTLTWWASQLGEAASAMRPGSEESTPRTPAFLPVRVVAAQEPGIEESATRIAAPTHRPATSFEVVLINGRRVRVGDGFDATALRRLLEVVEGDVRC